MGGRHSVWNEEGPERSVRDQRDSGLVGSVGPEDSGTEGTRGSSGEVKCFGKKGVVYV